MMYILWGIIAGMALNLFPLLNPPFAFEIFPEWHGKSEYIEDIQISENPLLSNIKLYSVKLNDRVLLLGGNGVLLKKIECGGDLISISGNGGYIAKYEKVGEEIEYLNIKGDRFWKIKSKEYPRLSFNGRLILLLNGDQSRVRILDHNGNNIGVKGVSGRLCTVISFSQNSDFAGIGFLDGGYYILNVNGEIAARDRIGGGAVVKGIEISETGDFAAVHYGNNSKDSVRLIDIKNQLYHEFSLRAIHHAKTAMHISNTGEFSVIDNNRIIITDKEGMVRAVIKIQPAEYGESSIDSVKDIYLAGYNGSDGISRFMVFRKDGTVLLQMEMPGERFVESFIRGRALFVRGSQGLYCYSCFH